MRKVKRNKWIKINKDYKEALEEIKNIHKDTLFKSNKRT